MVKIFLPFSYLLQKTRLIKLVVVVTVVKYTTIKAQGEFIPIVEYSKKEVIPLNSLVISDDILKNPKN
jgi:hypothetical protein